MFERGACFIFPLGYAENMKIVAVIPAYNEATRIAAAVVGVAAQVHEVVVVDDGSTDATADAAATAGARVLVHAVNRGQGAALQTGTEAALHLGADIIVHVDADGQHDPTFIPPLIAPLTQGEADVMFGSRFMGLVAEGMPLSRRMLYVGIRQFSGLVLGLPRRLTDPQTGMRALTRSAAMQLQWTQDRMAHCSEIMRLVTRSDLRWKEVPVKVRYTAESLAKGQKATDAFKVVWQLLLRSVSK